jgi:hypothetical protein
MTRIGVDISSIEQWRTRLDRTPAVRGSAFAASEAAWCRDEAASYALAWAAKEAAVKLLGTGFDGIGWRGVWSRPAATGIELGLGPQARVAPGAAGLAGPLRCAACCDGDRVVVALVAGGGDVAIRTLGFDCSGDRRTRHRAGRRAARRAAELAATACAPSPHAAQTWSIAANCAPAVRWEDGTAAMASFAHGRDLVCVGVVKEQRETSSPLRPSDVLTFEYDQRLRQQLLRQLPTNSQRGATCPRPLRPGRA